MKKFNNFIADKLSAAMATMALFWLLLILDVAGAIVDPPANVQAWLLWGVSILFQSVALPVLAFVSNKQAERTEEVLRQTHDLVMAELTLEKQERADMQRLLSELHANMKGDAPNA